MALLLGAALTPLAAMAGGVFLLADGTTHIGLWRLAAAGLFFGVLVVVPAVLLIVGDLVRRLEEQDLALGKLDSGLRRASQQASTQQLGLILLGRLRDRLCSLSSRLTMADEAGAAAGDDETPTRRLAEEVEVCTDLVARYEKLAVVREGPVLNLPLEVDGIIDDVLSLLQWEFYLRRIDIDRERQPFPPRALGDPIRLRQVLQSLLLNAIQAVGADGSIRVSTVATETEVRVTVSDSGPGIAAEVLERVFDPLFTTRDESVGLGLTLCRDLVGRMGGSISVGNGRQSGAECVVRLRADATKTTS